jgi:hypothetical protein
MFLFQPIADVKYSLLGQVCAMKDGDDRKVQRGYTEL